MMRSIVVTGLVRDVTLDSLPNKHSGKPIGFPLFVPPKSIGDQSVEEEYGTT